MKEADVIQFRIPERLIGRFAVVKLWPALKTAEDECIARLKIAGAALGIECVEIHADGRVIEAPDVVVSKKDVDFVLHLHYDTPKFYDAFSFVALWNPNQFYHDWGYQRTSRNLLSHDDFISCSSRAADDHVGRMVRNEKTHLPPLFNLYHSTADVFHSPTLGDGKLFYAGINWEALNGGKSRHQEVLKRLDGTGLMRIYGPTVFQKVKVWDGYQSYVKEIPFDGISMLEEIAKAGIALVLSSPAHKESELMSNRLFESIAAGALVICDENRFASRYFGDSLLYIDSRWPVEEIVEAIRAHLSWIKANPDQALAMIAKAQAIFRERFTLTRNLKDLYSGLEERKRSLLVRQGLGENESKIAVDVYCLMPEYSSEILHRHIASLEVQDYPAVRAVLVVDRLANARYHTEILELVSAAPLAIEVFEADFFDYGPAKAFASDRKLGCVIHDILENAARGEAAVFVAPNETLYSNHVQVLASSLMRNTERNCVASAAIMKNGEGIAHCVHEHIEFGNLVRGAPIGFGRFIFRYSGLADDLKLALPYLHAKPLAALVGDNVIHQETAASIVIDLNHRYPAGKWQQGRENEVIGDFAPKAFKVYRGRARDVPVVYAPASTATPYSRFSRRWLLYQARALRDRGLMSRFQYLHEKITNRNLGKKAGDITDD